MRFAPLLHIQRTLASLIDHVMVTIDSASEIFKFNSSQSTHSSILQLTIYLWRLFAYLKASFRIILCRICIKALTFSILTVIVSTPFLDSVFGFDLYSCKFAELHLTLNLTHVIYLSGPLSNISIMTNRGSLDSQSESITGIIGLLNERVAAINVDPALLSASLRFYSLKLQAKIHALKTIEIILSIPIRELGAYGLQQLFFLILKAFLIFFKPTHSLSSYFLHKDCIQTIYQLNVRMGKLYGIH